MQTLCTLISLLFFWLSWGLTTGQPLCAILCCLPEKGRKEIEEIVDKIKERYMYREERGTGMKVKKLNKNIPPLSLPATRIAGLAQLWANIS